MGLRPDVTWQASLLDGDAPNVDPSFGGLVRHTLDERCWVDVVPGWLAGSDSLLEELLETVSWSQPTWRIYDEEKLQPRLSGRLSDLPPVVDDMRAALSTRYGVDFDSVGVNLYRNGRDSVAWHGDRIPKAIVDPTVALVSLGHPRRFLLRPKRGGRSHVFLPGRGDLLVTGGATQREWQHSVPKVASAGPRVSLAFRHGMKKYPGS